MSKNLQKNGVVFDIDDLVCDTSLACGQFLWRELPLREFETVEAALHRWGTPDQVPEWQTRESQQLIFKALNDPEFLAAIQPVPRALEGAQQIEQQCGVSLYLTSRLPFSQQLTQEWLARHGFPLAPVICRDPKVLERDWKVKFLAVHFSETAALIDNELHVPAEVKYQGQLLELIRFKHLTPSHPRKKICRSWEEVLSLFVI